MEENVRLNKIFGQPIGAFSHPDVLDPSTKFAKKINRRFRVPFPIFELLVQRCEEANIFGIKVQRKFMEVYGELGMHGGLGSMVATHLHWNKCPKELRNLYKGKESYPILVFNVAVYHFHYIHHASNFYYGTVERYLHRSHHAVNDFCRRWV